MVHVILVVTSQHPGVGGHMGVEPKIGVFTVFTPPKSSICS